MSDRKNLLKNNEKYRLTYFFNRTKYSSFLTDGLLRNNGWAS
jgi:hypothetical protein